jgi:hypothetical protein
VSQRQVSDLVNKAEDGSAGSGIQQRELIEPLMEMSSDGGIPQRELDQETRKSEYWAKSPFTPWSSPTARTAFSTHETQICHIPM